MLDKYTKKEKLILNQYKNGPYHTMITNLTEKEHLQFVNKLIDDNDLYCVIFLTSIYTNYNQKFLIDYFIKCDDIDMLVNFLNTCNYFWNALDQKYIVDSILKLKNKNYVKKLLNTKCLYFLTNEGERKKLEDFIIK